MTREELSKIQSKMTKLHEALLQCMEEVTKHFTNTFEAVGKIYTEQDVTDDFKEGDLIIYQCGSRYEIGKIKRICEDGQHAFVYYHEGDTASRTPFEVMHKIENAYTIKETTLGFEQ